MQRPAETERLTFRELDAARDAAWAYRLNADPQVIRYTGDVAFADEAAARRFLAAYDDYRRHGMGRWLVVRRADGEPLGWCGLKRRDSGEVDLGYRFLREHWGRGYATEAARACLNLAFGSLGLTRVVAEIAEGNAASIRVAERLGMRLTAMRGRCGADPSRIYEALPAGASDVHRP